MSRILIPNQINCLSGKEKLKDFMVAVGGGDGHQKNLSDSREIKKTVPIDDLTIACLEIFKKNDANIQALTGRQLKQGICERLNLDSVDEFQDIIDEIFINYITSKESVSYSSDVDVDTSVAIKKKTTKDKKSTVDEKVSGRKRTKKLGSKDESLDRLKKYVYLCGVRRIWKRELEGLDYKGAKIHIEEILRDLGVEGRPTIEKCKNICKKREYEQELTSIDANNIINSRLRSRTSDSLEEISPLSTHQESSEYESGPQKRKPRINLLAFGDPEED